LFFLTDRPRQARWLEPEERQALEDELQRERELHRTSRHMTLRYALKEPKVLALAAAYFFIVTGNYGVEYFLPTILEKWYRLNEDQLRWLLVIPAAGSLVGQLFIGWNSDRTKERLAHSAIPIYIGAAALSATVLYQYPLVLMMVFFTIAAMGLKAYLPAFWALPSLFLTETAAAGSIGLINSVGNLGGFIGPKAMGWLSKHTGSYTPGIMILCVSMTIAATIVLTLPLGRRIAPAAAQPDSLPDAVVETV
jgi:ACS family tartrate transporter-like MFS transporter